MSSYLERKISKKARDLPAKSTFSKIAIRILIILVLIIGMIQGCNILLSAVRNAPIPNWEIASFRYQKLHALPNESMTVAQVDSAVAWWTNDSNAISEYRKEKR